MTTDEPDLGQVLGAHLVSLDLTATSRVEAIGELTDLLVADGRVTDAALFVADVQAREAQGPTGLGQGVAIPHGKSRAVATTSLAVGRCRTPLAWPSLDGGDVDVIILFAVREDDADSTHLRLLQQVARLLAHEEFLGQLHRVRTPHELVALFADDPENTGRSAAPNEPTHEPTRPAK
ncbi:PTS sugar transporter subunit IIA [Streptomyces sp. NPDC004111]|uniref:PTS sugar transporter subunit IIA n=1 Tax=Streptomyces sp. NPDC004111 TaxID=3364690 RepID=UPI0036C6773F